MKRDPLPSQVVLKLLTLAITIVVGFQLGPELGAGRAAASVGSVDQSVSQDACKAADCREPRILRVYLGDRLPPVRPADGVGVIARAAEAAALAFIASDGGSDIERLPIVKHVPRMECGDPPRI